MRLSLSQREEWAELDVEDNGVGIPGEDLARLFSHFHRGRNAAGYASNGLGLAIVKAIAEAHGASASAESSAGRTRFVLRLPAA